MAYDLATSFATRSKLFQYPFLETISPEVATPSFLIHNIRATGSHVLEGF